MSGGVCMRFTAVFLLPYDCKLAIRPVSLMLCLFTPEIDKQTSLSRFYFFIDTVSCLSFDEDIWPYLVKSEEKQAKTAPECVLSRRGR